jgi:hypothetical protein
MLNKVGDEKFIEIDLVVLNLQLVHSYVTTSSQFLKLLHPVL